MSHPGENYCKLLDLNPYQNYSDDQIQKAIENVKKQWEKELKNPNMTSGRTYQLGENLKLIPLMIRDLTNPVTKEKEFEEAKEILKSKLSGLMRKVIILTDGRIVIPPSATQNLKNRLSWNVVSNSTIKNALGDVAVTFKTSVNPRIVESYKRMNELDTHSPVELLNRVIVIREVNSPIGTVNDFTSPDDLRSAYETIYKRLEGMKPGRFQYQDIYYKAIWVVRNIIGSNEDLDELNRYCLCMRLLKPVFQQMDNYSGLQFTRTYIDSLLKDNVEDSTVIDLCIELLEEYCIKKEFPANFSEKESSLGTCPKCKSLIFTDSNCFYCPSCGFAINSICPCCGRAQTATNRFCVACSEDIDSSVKIAKSETEKIQDLLSSGRLEEARDAFGDLQKKYPCFDPIPQIEAKIKSATEKLNRICTEVETCYATSKFFTLKKSVENGLLLFPHFLDREDIRSRYDVACEKVALADSLCVEAAKVSEKESLEFYIRASEYCLDHPECVAKLKTIPPDGPADARFEYTDDGITLTYSVPEDRRGMRFCIYRNNLFPPEVDQSTTPLFETDGWVFNDNTAEPGIGYYYKIYSKRWGILSQTYAECGPAILRNEVTDMRIEPMEDGLKITYTRPHGCSRVRVWRKIADSAWGDEDEIFHNDTGTIIDSGLQSGTLYYYLFVSEYEFDGNILRSHGTTASGRTAELPSPADDLSVTWDKEHNCYVARWSNAENTSLYYALSRSDLPELHSPQKNISDTLTRIDPLDDGNGAFRFKLPDVSAVYVCPVLKIGDTYARGKECIVASVRPFRNLAYSIEERTCKLTVVWPKDAEKLFAVVTGTDADGKEDRTEYTVSRNDYESNGFFSFPLKGSAKTKVTVFAEYSVDGEMLRSIGRSTDIACHACSIIRYTLDQEPVKGNRKSARIRVRFSCSTRSNIPRCIMTVSDDAIPMRLDDGKQIWESDDPIVLLDGSTEANFVTSKENAKLEHMRLFFADREEYDRCHFMHPIFRRD